MRCAALPGSAPRRPRPPGDGSAPGRGPKTRPARATRLDWRGYPWVSSFFIQGYLMPVKTNKVVVMLGQPSECLLVTGRGSSTFHRLGCATVRAIGYVHLAPLSPALWNLHT